MKKTLFLLSLLPCVQAAEPLIDAAPVSIKQQIIYNSDQPISPEERQKALAMREVCRILDGVKDRATADAAADPVYEVMLVVHVGGPDHALADEPITGQQAVDYFTAAQDAGDAMRRAFFYGSEELAIAMGMPVEFAQLPEPAQLEAAGDYVKALREAVLVLSGVVDPASAETAVPRIKELRRRFGAAEAGMRGADQDNLLFAVGLEQGDTMSFAMVMTRLQECRFYGCADLAVATGQSAEAAAMCDTPTAEPLQQIKQTLGERFREHGITGGYGLDAQSPWVLPAAMPLGMALKLLPPYMTQCGDAVICPPAAPGLPSFTCVPVQVEIGDYKYKIELWFDTFSNRPADKPKSLQIEIR